MNNYILLLITLGTCGVTNRSATDSCQVNLEEIFKSVFIEETLYKENTLNLQYLDTLFIIDPKELLGSAKINFELNLDNKTGKYNREWRGTTFEAMSTKIVTKLDSGVLVKDSTIGYNLNKAVRRVDHYYVLEDFKSSQNTISLVLFRVLTNHKIEAEFLCNQERFKLKSINVGQY